MPQIAAQFGPNPLPSFDTARRYVAMYTTAVDPLERDRIARYMADTGDCVWHSLHVVMATETCWCSVCRRDR